MAIILRRVETMLRTSCGSRMRICVFRPSLGGSVCLCRTIATNSSEASAPPLLLKLRADMKNAMKAKDTNK